MEQKSYMDIQRLKPTFADGFQVGDMIIVQEKIDGANFSIRYDENDGTVKSFSRNRMLDPQNNLRGAWEWSQALDPEKVKSVLGCNLILFMEWLIPHTVQYPQERYKQAYCYDIYDTDTCQYMEQGIVKEKVEQLGLIYVPVFYEGEFKSWDHLMELVGKTELGGEYGEGIVVKNQTRLNDPNTRLPFYTKIVAERFCETKAHKASKPVDTQAIADRAKAQELTDSIVTEARVRKMLHKFVDDGVIPEDWDEHSMGVIAKNIGRGIYYDCQKEEQETVEAAGELFGKFAAATSMRIVREILKEKNKIAA